MDGLQEMTDKQGWLRGERAKESSNYSATYAATVDLLVTSDDLVPNSVYKHETVPKKYKSDTR